MKLRTRIIGISLIALILSTVIINAVTLTLMWKSMKNEAFAKAYKNSYENMQAFHKLELDDENIRYYLKTNRNEFIVCMRITHPDSSGGTIEVEEIYNHTIFDGNDFINFDYKTYEDMNYAYVNYADKRYVVFSKDISDIFVYIFEDITYVSDNMKKMMICSSIIMMVVISAAVLLLFKILNREFEPLQELSDMTKCIADNKYDQRIMIHNNNEIGQIAQNFNKMADAVEYRTKSLEESERRKTIFMGNLTHELKTPMTSISGYAQTLLSVKLNEEDRTEALNYIYKECVRLERLSHKMMQLLELDYEREPEFEMVPVKDLFDAAAKSCNAVLKNKNIILEYEEHGETFFVDADLMTDVIINLIDNGIKASSDGGKIILRSYGKCIEVQDFGKGIPKEEQDKIMEPFYMVDKSRSRKSGGAGLGLALTALIVKKHHAALTIESEIGTGTKMILQFV